MPKVFFDVGILFCSLYIVLLIIVIWTASSEMVSSCIYGWLKYRSVYLIRAFTLHSQKLLYMDRREGIIRGNGPDRSVDAPDLNVLKFLTLFPTLLA